MKTQNKVYVVLVFICNIKHNISLRFSKNNHLNVKKYFELKQLHTVK